MAKDVDKDGSRTLGVLTKPDMIDEGTEYKVVGQVRGDNRPLKLGYYILRNRGALQEKASSQERDELERGFFAHARWSELVPDHVGVNSLKKRLQQLLISITRRELPNVKRQINDRLRKCKKELVDMGPDRSSTVEQQIYLQQMAVDFQKITDQALDAYYARNPIFADFSGMRLPTLVVDRSDKFAIDMSNKGHSVEFDLEGETNEDRVSIDDNMERDQTQAETSEPDNESDNYSYTPGTPQELSAKLSETRDKYPELWNLFEDGLTYPQFQEDDILKWIEKEYRSARGSGLESISPAVLPTLWQQQSRKWRGLTMNYLSDVIVYVHDFIWQLMEHICPEDYPRQGIMAIVTEKCLEQYKVAIDHVEFLIQVEVFGTPLTKNPDFQKNLHRYRLERLGAAMSKVAIDTNLAESNDQPARDRVVRLEDVMLSSSMGNVEHAVNDIYCILKSYYQTARRRYVDAVCTQGTDYHLLNGEHSPLRIFSPMFVASLRPEQLEEIAGEDFTSRDRREKLKREIEALEKGKLILST